MKTIIRIFTILIIPFAFIILSLIFKNSVGELYLANLYDPSYVYLINSLNLSQCLGVGHFDHPGTTVQEIGAIVIFISSFVSGVDKVKDVFSHPEYYLSLINFVFIIINSIALFILGFVTFKRLGNIFTALVLQLSPFISSIIFERSVRMSTEPLLVFTVLILMISIVYYLTEKNTNTKKWRIEYIYIYIYALICGFGLVTKISFFPLLIIPIILINKISRKALFCGLTVVAFILFVFPAISSEHIQKFINWIKKITLYSGKYGTGERNFVNSSGFFKNFLVIFSEQPVFLLSYLLILASSIVLSIKKFRQKFKLNKNQKLLIGIFLTMSLQIIIVCKHFELHYLIPAYMLTILGLYISNSVLTDLFPTKRGFSKSIYLTIVIVIIIIFQIINFHTKISYLSLKRDASENIVKYVEDNYKHSVIVSSYGTSNKAFAIHLGSWFGGSQKKSYIALVRNLYPNNYFYDKWSKNIVETDDLTNIKNVLSNSGTIVFLTDNESTVKDFHDILINITNNKKITFKKMFSIFTGEAVYECNVSSGKGISE